MGKGRGKGKKQSAIAKREEHGNEGDKDSGYRLSGKQENSLKDETEEVEAASGNIENMENIKVKNSSTDNKRKRKRTVPVKEHVDPVKEESAIKTKGNPDDDDDSKKPAGFRQNGSRRKNKPRRAAEAGVDCSLQSEIFV